MYKGRYFFRGHSVYNNIALYMLAYANAICEEARPSFNCTLYLQNGHRHGYADVTLHTINTQKYTTEFSPYLSSHDESHPITFSPGAAAAVAARLLWVGLTCLSLRGRFSRLTFSRGSYLPTDVATNRHGYVCWWIAPAGKVRRTHRTGHVK